MERLIRSRTEDYYGDDRGCPLAYEPSGQDFLSPCLAEADLIRRVREPDAFAAWLDGFLPGIPRARKAPGKAWLEPAVVTDPSDGKLAHLDGLNLSRAWMLEGIAAGLPAGDPRLPALRETARRHREAGLAAVTGWSTTPAATGWPASPPTDEQHSQAGCMARRMQRGFTTGC